jgi:type I restriction enzyme S subunit
VALDVRPDHLALVRAILAEQVPGRRVLAFGSRVLGKARPVSDLDLAVVGSVPLSFEKLAALRDAFSESNIPYKVDVVDWATTSESFREIIGRQAVVVQEEERRDGT